MFLDYFQLQMVFFVLIQDGCSVPPEENYYSYKTQQGKPTEAWVGGGAVYEQ